MDITTTQIKINTITEKRWISIVRLIVDRQLKPKSCLKSHTNKPNSAHQGKG